ncbi:hypothetical protein ACODNH_20040 (plasmid) [Haloarcula sp. NS06]|uniref:hypothetical protein n=1 Tax=Haloarcula sp. NS06 TaxID=3409688 RepID=UPI0027B3B3AF|nr:hypothetical protein [Haloarcula sp. H-GB4]MDQ2074511.1 hypothetical protein [Haloarcula sp. H-GB4]
MGDYDVPDVRLPGSGGACEIAGNVERTTITTSYQRQRFHEKTDFATSPGFIDSEGAREKHGLRAEGFTTVITDMAVMGFQNEEMVVESIHPGVGREDVREATGWEIKFADDVGETEPPTDDELRLILKELDPDGVYL